MPRTKKPTATKQASPLSAAGKGKVSPARGPGRPGRTGWKRITIYIPGKLDRNMRDYRRAYDLTSISEVAILALAEYFTRHDIPTIKIETKGTAPDIDKALDSIERSKERP